MLHPMDEYEKIKWAAFARELEKEAFWTGVARGVGQRVIGAASAGAKALGVGGRGSMFTNALTKGIQMSGGGANFQRNVGIGAGALGAAGLAMAGRATAPTSPMGY